MHGHWLKDYIGPKASANSGGGTEPLIVRFDHKEEVQQGTILYYDKTWQEVADALTANRPVYAKYGNLNEGDGSYEEDNASLVPIYRAYAQTVGGSTAYFIDVIDANAIFNDYNFIAASADGQIVVRKLLG